MQDVEEWGRVPQVLTEEAARYTLDQLPAWKHDTMQAVRADVGQYFEKRGILISSVGVYSGLTYANPDIQRAIDDRAKVARRIGRGAAERGRAGDRR